MERVRYGEKGEIEVVVQRERPVIPSVLFSSDEELARPKFQTIF